MTSAAIPSWTADGVLPPIDVSNPVSPNRSPYVVSLAELVLRFSETPERRRVLEGFLRYRAALHAAGMRDGFQWVDGSFLENVELLEARAPADVDVVTFFRLPPGIRQADVGAAHGALLDHDALKATFLVDAYYVDLAMPAERLIQKTAYWYSVWSHRRDRRWKGFVQVDLAPTGEPVAAAALRGWREDGGEP